MNRESETELPICPVCSEEVDWGMGDSSGTWWHPECFRDVVQQGGTVPKPEKMT